MSHFNPTNTEASADNQSDDEVMEILEKFYKKVFEHSYLLGQEFPDDKDPSKIFDPCNADDKIDAKAALDQHYGKKTTAAIQAFEEKLKSELEHDLLGHDYSRLCEAITTIQAELTNTNVGDRDE